MFQGPQLGKTDSNFPESQGFSLSGIQQMPSLTNNFFIFHPEVPSMPFQYPMIYSFDSSYNYFSNPCFPSYSYFASPLYANTTSSGVRTPPNTPIKNEIILYPGPAPIVVKVQEPAKSYQKPIQTIGNEIQSQIKVESAQSRKSKNQNKVKRRRPIVNLEVKIIFKKLITSLLSKQPISDSKLEAQIQLKKLSYLVKAGGLYESIYQNLYKKINQYKKTKEELTKYIIRRSYQNYKTRKGQNYQIELDELWRFHLKNLDVFKSMNKEFMKKEFSNRSFLEIYKSFLVQLDEQLQKDNQQKIQRFAEALSLRYCNRNINHLIMYYNRVPWNKEIHSRIKQLALHLLKKYHKCCNEPQVQEHSFT